MATIANSICIKNENHTMKKNENVKIELKINSKEQRGRNIELKIQRSTQH
jgi:hypothetical protein